MEKFFVLCSNEDEFNIVNTFYKKGWSRCGGGYEGYTNNNEFINGNNYVYNNVQVEKMRENGYYEYPFIEWERVFINGSENQYEIY